MGVEKGGRGLTRLCQVAWLRAKQATVYIATRFIFSYTVSSLTLANIASELNTPRKCYILFVKISQYVLVQSRMVVLFLVAGYGGRRIRRHLWPRPRCSTVNYVLGEHLAIQLSTHIMAMSVWVRLGLITNRSTLDHSR